MNKPHVHAEFIKAKADGAIVQELYSGGGGWRTMSDADFTFFNNYQYRIKPEREYPVTSLSMDELFGLYAGYSMPQQGIKSLLVKIANAAIKQYIIDTEKE